MPAIAAAALAAATITAAVSPTATAAPTITATTSGAAAALAAATITSATLASAVAAATLSSSGAAASFAATALTPAASRAHAQHHAQLRRVGGVRLGSGFCARKHRTRPPDGDRPLFGHVRASLIRLV